MALIVIQCVMEHAAVVPNAKLPGCHLKRVTNSSLVKCLVRNRNGQTFVSGPAFNVDGVGLTVIDAFVPRLFMCTDQRCLPDSANRITAIGVTKIRLPPPTYSHRFGRGLTSVSKYLASSQAPRASPD